MRRGAGGSPQGGQSSSSAAQRQADATPGRGDSEPLGGGDLGCGLGHSVGGMDGPTALDGPAGQWLAQVLSAHQNHTQAVRGRPVKLQEPGQHGRDQGDMRDGMAHQVLGHRLRLEALAQDLGSACEDTPVGDRETADVTERQTAEPGVRGFEPQATVGQVRRCPSGFRR